MQSDAQPESLESELDETVLWSMMRSILLVNLSDPNMPADVRANMHAIIVKHWSFHAPMQTELAQRDAKIAKLLNENRHQRDFIKFLLEKKDATT